MFGSLSNEGLKFVETFLVLNVVGCGYTCECKVLLILTTARVVGRT